MSVYVCVYAYIYTYYIYICMYTYVYSFCHDYLNQWIFIFAFVYLYIYIHMHICLYLYMYMSTSMYICIHVKSTMHIQLDGQLHVHQMLAVGGRVDRGATEPPRMRQGPNGRGPLRGTHGRGPLDLGSWGALGSLWGVLIYGSPLYGVLFRIPSQR